MFDKDFYPTPDNLIDKMLDGVNLSMIHSILEPSAGKGDIVEHLKRKETETNEYYTKYKFDIDCIEKDSSLKCILKSKGFRVVHDDFLTYSTMKEYDLIIMNPPFSNGCKHLLKALEMQRRNGGAIISLLNAETLRNKCSNERIALSHMLKEYHADIQYMQNAFVDGERKTEVEIALIKVQLPEVKKTSIILENLKKAETVEESDVESNYEPADNDLFKVIVAQYQKEVRAGINLIKEFKAVQSLVMKSFTRDEKTGRTKLESDGILQLKIEDTEASENEYVKRIRGKYWTALFKNPKFMGQLTNNLLRDYHNQIDELKNYEFSLYNIYELKLDMNKKIFQGIEDTIVELFDELSSKYAYYDECKNNIHYYNGWRTNKAWIINKKVIIVLNGWYNLGYSFGGFKPTRYDVINKLRDIEKCLNYLDGGLTESVDLEKTLADAEKNEKTKNISLKYFNVTFYKKGTCHITFTNEELLKKFNIFGSQHKGWLPPSYGKKMYHDMQKEEQQIVDAFEGEKAYETVVKNREYYFSATENMLMLE